MRKLDPNGTLEGFMDEVRALRRELRRKRREVAPRSRWWEYVLIGGAVLAAIAGGMMIVWMVGTLP